jgi:hypothetical protein
MTAAARYRELPATSPHPAGADRKCRRAKGQSFVDTFGGGQSPKRACGTLFVGASFAAISEHVPISRSSVQILESGRRSFSLHNVGLWRRRAEQPPGFLHARPPSRLRCSSRSTGRERSAPLPSPELDGRAIDKREFPQASAEPSDRRTCRTQMHWLIPQGGRYSPK